MDYKEAYHKLLHHIENRSRHEKGKDPERTAKVLGDILKYGHRLEREIEKTENGR